MPQPASIESLITTLKEIHATTATLLPSTTDKTDRLWRLSNRALNQAEALMDRTDRAQLDAEYADQQRRDYYDRLRAERET